MLGDIAVDAYRLGDIMAQRVFAGDVLVWEANPTELTVGVDTFEPVVALRTGSSATVTWTDEHGTPLATGLAPTITWQESGPHKVQLHSTNIHDIEMLNLGYYDGQDGGIYRAGTSALNRPTQGVIKIDNLQTLTGLVLFLCARTNGSNVDGFLYTGPLLTGHLNFSGMKNLEFVECFQSQPESVTLTGCNSLIRLCLEQCNIATLDLNPVRGTLRDIRAAYQTGGTLTLAPLAGPLIDLYHFCPRSQTLIGMPIVETMLPAVRQLWTYQDGLDLDEMTIRSSEDLHTVILANANVPGPDNRIGRLDLDGQNWGALSGPIALRAAGVGMETITMVGMTGPLPELRLERNQLDETSVDHVLAVVNSLNTSGGILNLSGEMMHPPSASGIVDANALVGRGWTVSYVTTAPDDTPPAPGVLLWADEFDRADTTGYANVGWLEPIGGGDLSIVSGELVFSGGSGYQEAFIEPPELGGITDYVVELEFDAASQSGGYFGVLAHMDASTNDGRKLFFGASASALPVCGKPAGTGGVTATEIPPGIPTSWTDPGVHTIRWQIEGMDSTIILDGVAVATYSNSKLSDGASGVGICGESRGRSWRAIRVYALP